MNKLLVSAIGAALISGAWLAFEGVSRSESVTKIKDGLSPATRTTLAQIVEYYQDKDRRGQSETLTPTLYCSTSPLDVFSYSVKEIERDIPATDFAALSIWQRQDLVFDAMKDSLAVRSGNESDPDGRHYYVTELATYVHNMDPLCAFMKDGELKQTTNYLAPTESWGKTLQYQDEHSLRAYLDEPMSWLEQDYVKRSQAMAYDGLSAFWPDDIVGQLFKGIGDFIIRLVEPLVRFLLQILWVRIAVIELLLICIVGWFCFLGADFLKFTSRNS